MRRLAVVLAALLALPASAQGWSKASAGWGKVSTGPGGATGLTYNSATDTSTFGTISARNLTATALATPTVTSVTPTLTQVGTINVVAGASLADGDYFTVDYGSGTIPIEFEATPPNGTTGGRIPFTFAAGDAAGTIRDGLIALINLAAPTKVVASIGAKAAITVSMVTPGEAGGVITENVANAGFTVAGFTNPTAATTYGYVAVSYLADGTSTAASTEVTTAAGHATLSAADYVTVVYAPSAGSVSTRLYRKTGGVGAPRLLYTGTATSYVDVGDAGTAQTPATVNTTGTLTGRGVFATGTTVTPGTGTATARVGGVLHVSTTSQATTGTAEEVLATYTMPANTLARDGQAVRITVGAKAAANTNAKTLRIRVGGIGGTVIQDQQSSNYGAAWDITAKIIRTGATAQLVYASGVALSVSKATETATTATLSGDVSIVVTGETPSGAGEITFKLLLVEALN